MMAVDDMSTIRIEDENEWNIFKNSFSDKLEETITIKESHIKNELNKWPKQNLEPLE